MRREITGGGGCIAAIAGNTLIIVVLDHSKLTQAVMEMEDCLIGATAVINILLAI